MNAKMCEELGVLMQSHAVHNRNHLDKIMAICIVGFAFTGDPFNGGEGIKIILRRCQCAKIAKKKQYETYRDEDGELKYHKAATRYSTRDGVWHDGAGDLPKDIDHLKRSKGDCYMVDCNVKGTDQGTSNDPK